MQGQLSWLASDRSIRLGTLEPSVEMRWQSVPLGPAAGERIEVLPAAGCAAVLCRAADGAQQLRLVDLDTLAVLHVLPLLREHRVLELGVLSLGAAELLVVSSCHLRVEGPQTAQGLLRYQPVLSFLEVRRRQAQHTEAMAESFELLLHGVCPAQHATTALLQLPQRFCAEELRLPQHAAALLAGSAEGVAIYQVQADLEVGRASTPGHHAFLAAFHGLEASAARSTGRFPLPELDPYRSKNFHPSQQGKAVDAEARAAVEAVAASWQFPQGRLDPQGGAEDEEAAAGEGQGRRAPMSGRQRVTVECTAMASLEGAAALGASWVEDTEVPGQQRPTARLLVWDALGRIYALRCKRGPHGAPVLLPLSAIREGRPARSCLDGSRVMLAGEVRPRGIRTDPAAEGQLEAQYDRLLQRAVEAGQLVAGQSGAEAILGRTLLPGVFAGLFTGDNLSEALQNFGLAEQALPLPRLDVAEIR